MSDESADRRDDPAFVTGMFAGQFTAGVMRIMSKYAVEGTLGDLVDEFTAGPVRLIVNGSGVIDAADESAPPSGN